jgi:regulator of sirC expression with transglutaminase-like and TPR domain
MGARLSDEFARLVAVGDGDINLAAAALAIARLDYPALDVPAYLRRLDEMAETVRSRLGPGPDAPVDVVRALNRYLFLEQGFAGNAREYYDPRNSFLNEVMDRRLGIPVTLSLVYMEVGWRLGLPLEGVSFPGHFLVKFPLDQGEVVLDPFHQGISLGLEDLAERAQAAVGDRTTFDLLAPQILAGADRRDVLARMLGNLKAIYAAQEDPARLLHVTSLMVVLQPDRPDAVLARARAYQAVGNEARAAADYLRYLELAPEEDDAEEIRGVVVELQARPSRLH